MVPPHPVSGHASTDHGRSGVGRWFRRPGDVDVTRDVAIVFGTGLALSATYLVSGPLHLGLPCLLKLTTGWDCPLCGGTRMGAAVLRGDLVAAWHFNPVALIGTALLGVWFAGALLYQVGVLRRPMPRPRGRLQKGLGVALVVVLVAFAVGRNLPFGPLAGFKV
jgi:Protein of unknown function (DUF2752)